MTSNLLLMAALTLVPQQPGTLTLENARLTYGEVGSVRTETKFLPGDVFFLSFDMKGIKIDDEGQAAYTIGMQVLDPTGKETYKSGPEQQNAFLPLGGGTLPARAFVSIGFDQPPGIYTCKVTVTDILAKSAPKLLEQQFEVLPKSFGIVQVYTTTDLEGKNPAPLTGVAGQTMFIHFVIIGFDRDATKKQPNVTLTMRIFDKDSKVTLPKPVTKNIPDAREGAVDEKSIGVPMRLMLPLSREGGYLVELASTDNLTGKKSVVYLPVRVFPPK
ncbi:MAG: hypothetical protein R3B84_08865 [Zavarzinella sp.]